MPTVAPALPVLSVVKLATEGEEITIHCNVESWPLPSSLNLSWSSAKDPSMHHLLHRVSNAASLTKRLNVTSASAGRYTCRAQNTQGSNQSETDLTVNCELCSLCINMYVSRIYIWINSCL